MLLLYFTYSFRHVRSRCDPQHLVASRAPVLVRSTLLAKAVCIIILTRKEVEEDECPVHLVFRITGPVSRMKRSRRSLMK